MIACVSTTLPEPITTGTFTDRFGAVHHLVPGHRDRLKPGWRRMLHDDPPPPTDAELRIEMDGLSDRLKLAEQVLRTFGSEFAGRDVLSVGCGDALEPLFVAARGAQRTVGLDRGVGRTDNARLTRVGHAYLAEHGMSDVSDAAVELRAEDIGFTRLPDATFDLVCSWRTLEHLIEPAAAFDEMYRVLRPGGLAYHEYNPFFGLDGGHSLVTLDVPWGHVRFDRDDLDGYLKRCRPAERERALAYYDICLNRMSLADLERIIAASGFETLALVPRTRTEDLLEVDAGLLTAARQQYADLTLNDLICRIVRVVLRRPLDS